MKQKEMVLHLLDRLQIVSYVTAKDLTDHQNLLDAAEYAESAESVGAPEEAEKARQRIEEIEDIKNTIEELRDSLDAATAYVLTWWSKPPSLLLDLYR